MIRLKFSFNTKYKQIFDAEFTTARYREEIAFYPKDGYLKEHRPADDYPRYYKVDLAAEVCKYNGTGLRSTFTFGKPRVYTTDFAYQVPKECKDHVVTNEKTRRAWYTVHQNSSACVQIAIDVIL